MHVSVGKVRRGARGVDYYNKLSREDYYLASGSGRWWGSLAVEFGLSGEVKRDDFCAIHEGFSPKGEPLCQNNRLRRPGFDVTHSLVKDSSILASINDEWRKRITEEVANPAIEASLRFLEREACYSRRGKYGAERVKGTGFVASCFDHIVTREVDGKLDPQLHRHVVVGNTCRGADGQLRTLDAEYLFHYAKTAAALATVEEAYQLKRLGFELERVKGQGDEGPARKFRIIGIPDELREEDSRRRRQIVELAGEKSSGKKRDEANLVTREPKKDVDVREVLKDWDERNKRHGLTLARVEELRGRGKRVEVDVAAELRLASHLAMKDVCRQESTFKAHEFLERLCLHSLCRGVSANDVRLHAWAELEKARRGLSKDFVFLGRDTSEDERWTTRELYELEKKVIALSEKRKDRASSVTKAATEEAIAERPLNPDQANAVRHLCLSPGQVKCLVGGAGTGKTFALDAVREAIEASGGVVIGTSLSSRATRELKTQGHIEHCFNIRKLLYEMDKGRVALTANTYLIMDEAAMTGTRDYARLVREVNDGGATLLCTGDHRQHQAIEAGGSFVGLVRRLPTPELKEIVRQTMPEERKLVEAFRDRRINDALSSLARRKKLDIGDGVKETQRELVKLWAWDETAVPEKMVVASTNAQRQHLSLRCQRVLAKRGVLSGDGIEIEAGIMAYVGDKILFRKNAPLIDVVNGDFATVIGVDKDRSEMRVKLDGDGRTVTVSLKTYDREKIQLGYSVTSHLSQGGSFSKIYLFVSGNMTDAQTAYVMGSRHKDSCHLFTTLDDAGDLGLTKLVRTMSRDRTKLLAHDTQVTKKQEKHEVERRHELSL
jgi:conjugative relaxase-like TrwC/TraI family protein